MNIIDRKKLKSKTLLAAICAQGVSGFFMNLLHLSRYSEDGDKKINRAVFSSGALEYAHREGYRPIYSDHPVYDISQDVAKKSGVILTDIFMNAQEKSYNASVSFDGPYAAIYFSGNFLKIPDHGKLILESVVAHEVAHAQRRLLRGHVAVKNTHILTGAMCCVYLIVGGLTGMPAPVLWGMGMSAFSAVVGVPVLARMLSRNEEYLADIGSAKITGKPEDMMNTLDFLNNVGLEAKEGLGVFEKISYSIPPVFGRTHPSFKNRKKCLSKVFNVDMSTYQPLPYTPTKSYMELVGKMEP